MGGRARIKVDAESYKRAKANQAKEQAKQAKRSSNGATTLRVPEPEPPAKAKPH